MSCHKVGRHVIRNRWQELTDHFVESRNPYRTPDEIIPRKLLGSLTRKKKEILWNVELHSHGLDEIGRMHLTVSL